MARSLERLINVCTVLCFLFMCHSCGCVQRMFHTCRRRQFHHHHTRVMYSWYESFLCVRIARDTLTLSKSESTSSLRRGSPVVLHMPPVAKGEVSESVRGQGDSPSSKVTGSTSLQETSSVPPSMSVAIAIALKQLIQTNECIHCSQGDVVAITTGSFSTSVRWE